MTVDDYISAQPEPVREILQRVRAAIRKAVPNAEESITYRIPTLVAAFKDELAPYEISKGTIRFPLTQPVPVKLIERIAKFRAKESSGQS